MRCNDTLWQIPEDAGVDGPQDESLRLHLASCPGCRERLSALQDAVLVLKTAPRQAPEPGFAGRVMSRIALERNGAKADVSSRWVAIVGLAIVAAALVALVLVWAGSEAFMSLRPGGAILVGLASFFAGLANLVVRLSAVARAFVAAARSLPPNVLQALEYSLQLCCVLAFVTVIWMAGRGRRPSSAGFK